MTDRTKEDVILELTDAVLLGGSLHWVSFYKGMYGGISAEDPWSKVGPEDTIFLWEGSRVIDKETLITLERAKNLVNLYWERRVND